LKKSLLIALVLSLISLAVALMPQDRPAPKGALTAAEVIAHCAQAMGGISRIDRLKTLRVGAVYPDHLTRPLFVEIKRPNMSYNPQGQLAFDGKRACFLKGQDQNSKPEMIDPRELVDYDVENGYFFPAFFDFPSEYLGTDTVDGLKVHKIRPKLPHGAELVYYIDASTWLPYKTRVHMTIHGQSHDTERVFSDYKNVDGILYPHGFTYPSRDRKTVVQGRVTSVELNPVLDPAHFTIPEDIK